MTGLSLEAQWPPLVLVIGVLIAALCVWQLVVRPKRRLAWARRLALAILASVMALQPAVPGGEVPTARVDARVFVLVDTSQSIAAEDHGGAPRLNGVRDDVVEIARAFSGADISVISFDSKATIRVPLTDDGSAVIEMMRALRPELALQSQGTSVAVAHDLLKTELERTEAADPNSSAIVFYLGDGEHTSREEPQSFADVAPLIDQGLVLGYGTEEGGRMQVSGFGTGEEPAYVQDPAGGDALSKRDEQQLSAIASQLGVTYVSRDAETSIAETLAPMADLQGAAELDSTARARMEIAWIFAIPVALLLAWEGLSLARSLRVTRGLYQGGRG